MAEPCCEPDNLWPLFLEQSRLWLAYTTPISILERDQDTENRYIAKRRDNSFAFKVRGLLAFLPDGANLLGVPKTAKLRDPRLTLELQRHGISCRKEAIFLGAKAIIISAQWAHSTLRDALQMVRAAACYVDQLVSSYGPT